MLVGEGLFRPEDGTGLEDALEAGGHGHLLVELRALGQVGVAVEVLHFKYVRAALAGRRDQLRRVDLHEVFLQAELAQGVDQAGLRLEDQLVLVRPEVDPAEVQALIDAGAFHSLFFLGGRDAFAGDGKSLGQRFHDDLVGDHFAAAELDVFILNDGADDGDHAVGGQAGNGFGHGRKLFLFDGDLQTAGDVL